MPLRRPRTVRAFCKSLQGARNVPKSMVRCLRIFRDEEHQAKETGDGLKSRSIYKTLAVGFSYPDQFFAEFVFKEFIV